MTHKKRLTTTGYYVVSIIIAAVSMFPFLWMISTSLKSQGGHYVYPHPVDSPIPPRQTPMCRYLPSSIFCA